MASRLAAPGKRVNSAHAVGRRMDAPRNPRAGREVESRGYKSLRRKAAKSGEAFVDSECVDAILQ